MTTAYWWGLRIYFNHNDSNIIIAGGEAAADVVRRAGAPAWVAPLILGAVALIRAADRGNGIYFEIIWWTGWFWIRTA